VAHGYAWASGIFMEAVIGAVLLSQQELIPIPGPLIDTLFGLGMGRILTLGLMVALLARRQYLLRPEKGSADEGQSLLENNDRPTNGYGAVNGSPAKPKPTDTRQPRTVSWFDYFAGFQVLFPYLWCVGYFSLDMC
jgi:hypothetical protein